MTPVQVAGEIKRLDKEIAKADAGIHASRALYEPDLRAIGRDGIALYDRRMRRTQLRSTLM